MDNNINGCLNKLKIGFKNYAIEKPDDINEIRGEYYGTHDYDKSLIKIVAKYEQNDKNHTLIHEVLHAICARFGLEDISKDEKAIDLLALGIYEAILDNPHIFKMTDI